MNGILSNKAQYLIHFMIKELSTMKYGYQEIVEGCYDAAIENFNIPQPDENKDLIIDKVIEILNKEG